VRYVPRLNSAIRRLCAYLGKQPEGYAVNAAMVVTITGSAQATVFTSVDHAVEAGYLRVVDRNHWALGPVPMPEPRPFVSRPVKDESHMHLRGALKALVSRSKSVDREEFRRGMDELLKEADELISAAPARGPIGGAVVGLVVANELRTVAQVAIKAAYKLAMMKEAL
jgi:hypothetical protein